jgi:hypothetical protein
MSDNDTDDIIPDTELRAISVYPYGDEGRYKIVLVGADGTITAYYTSEPRLVQAFAVIGEALQPGLLASLTVAHP